MMAGSVWGWEGCLPGVGTVEAVLTLNSRPDPEVDRTGPTLYCLFLLLLPRVTAWLKPPGAKAAREKKVDTKQLSPHLGGKH